MKKSEKAYFDPLDPQFHKNQKLDDEKPKIAKIDLEFPRPIEKKAAESPQ